MLRIDADDRLVIDALRQIAGRIGNLSPALQDIGLTLAESTTRRFDTSTGPDGQRWAANSQTTILQYLGVYNGSYSKQTGKISAKGSERAATKRPLIGETRSLSSTIAWQMVGKTSVEVGSHLIYAGVQQFGANKRAFGDAPWGDIPARPFLGVSEADRQDILDILSDYMSLGRP